MAERTTTKSNEFLKLFKWLKIVFSLLILSCQILSLLAGTCMQNVSLAQQKLSLMFNNFNLLSPNIIICFCKFLVNKLLTTADFFL